MHKVLIINRIKILSNDLFIFFDKKIGQNEFARLGKVSLRIILELDDDFGEKVLVLALLFELAE